MITKKTTLLFFLFIFGWIFLFTPAYTNGPKVVITEIGLYEKSDCEWIEIYNKSNRSIDIGGWKLWEHNTNHGINISKQTKHHTSSTVIDSGQYALIANNSGILLAPTSTQKHKHRCKRTYRIPTSTPVFDSSWGSLKESGEELALKKSSKFADVVEKFTYISTSTVDTSLERLSVKNLDYTKNNWSFLSLSSSTPTGTPGKQNWNSINIKPTSSSKKMPSYNIQASSSISKNITTSLKVVSSSGVKYEWNLKGNKHIQATSSVIKYSFSESKEYLVTSLGYNSLGAVNVQTTTIDVTEPPTARIDIPTSSKTNKEIKFSDKNSSSPTSIESFWWNFGDSVTSTSSTTTHSYFSTGTYKVKLRIQDKNKGTDTATGSINIKTNKNNNTSTPQAVIRASSTKRTGASVLLDGSNSVGSNIENYTWKIDEEEKKGVTTTYTFRTSSTYTFSLTVSTTHESDSAVHTIDITTNRTSSSSIPTSSDKIVINEFLPNPSSGNEWIELYNPTPSSTDLNGWSIFDGAGKIDTLSSTIKAGGFTTLSVGYSKLNNKGDVIKLKNGVDNIIDKTSYGNWEDSDTSDNAPAPTQGNSLARKPDSQDKNNDKKDFKETISQSKNAINKITTPNNQQKEGRANNSQNQTVTENSSDGGADFNSDYGQEISPSDVVINEVVSDPTDKQEEFVELYNNKDVSVDLSGWKIEDANNNSTEIEKQTINPSGFVVIENGYSFLNNGGDELSLYSAKNNKIDSVVYGKKPFSSIPEETQSLARKKDGVDSNNHKRDFKITDQITKGSKNIIRETSSTPTTTPNKSDKKPKETKQSPNSDGDPAVQKFTGGHIPFSDLKKIKINEILPNPRGSDKREFIELFNPTNKPIYIGKTKLDDEKGGSNPFQISRGTTIKPKSYVLLTKNVTGISLNNTGDKTRILSPSGSLITEISYQRAKEGSSFDGAGWSNIITPGFKNNTPSNNKKHSKNTNKETQISKYKKVKLEDIEKLQEGEEAITRGTVAVKPGIISSRFFYITGSPGIQVYNHKKKFPQLSVGDRIEVKGEISEAYGNTRIKTDGKSDIRTLSHPGKPKPKQIEIEEVLEENEGKLVKLQGEITEQKGNYFYLDDGTGETKVYIKDDTKINPSNFVPGDLAKVSGIIAQRGDEYRILPRSTKDIEKTGTTKHRSTDTKENKNGNTKLRTEDKIEKYIIASAGAIIIILLTLLLKERNQ